MWLADSGVECFGCIETVGGSAPAPIYVEISSSSDDFISVAYECVPFRDILTAI